MTVDNEAIAGDERLQEALLEVRHLRLNLAQLAANYQCLEQLRAQAEARERGLARALRGIAETLIPERLAELARQDPVGFGSLPAVDLARLVQTEAAAKLYRLQVGQPAPDVGRAQQLELRLRELAQESAVLQARLAESEAERQRAEARARALEARVAALMEQRAAGQEAPVAVEADLEGEARDHALLRLLATTGLSRRKEIERLLQERHGVPEGGSMQRLFERAVRAGWLVTSRPKPDVRGRSTELVRLSDAGVEEVRRRWGLEPLPSEWQRLVARHGSDAHVLLTLDARDHLLRFGATAVDLDPAPVPTPDGGTFAPDLVAVLEGRPLYVECERDTRKDPVARKRKWANYYQVTQDFCLICPDAAAQKAVVSEITAWALEAQRAVRLHVACLARTTDRLWTLEREIRPRNLLT